MLPFPGQASTFHAAPIFSCLTAHTMNYSCRNFPRLLILAFAALLLGAGQAQAKRVPKLYTFGPANSEVGPVKAGTLAAQPAEVRTPFEALGVDTVGFHYQHFGLFWLDIWSWSGRYTVYNKMHDVPYPVTNAQAAALLGIKESELKKPLSYHIPWGLVIIVALALLKFLPRFLARRKAARELVAFNSSGAWSPPPSPPAPAYQPPSFQPPHAPPAGGPPPMPPPLPPDGK